MAVSFRIFLCFLFFILTTASQAMQKMCQVTEKYILRPTATVFQNNTLYLLSQSYGAFGSLNLKTCQYHYITGGEKVGFVMPKQLFYLPQKNAWLITDPAQGVTEIKDGKAIGQFTKLNPGSGFARIDKNTLATLYSGTATVYKVDINKQQSSILSDSEHGQGPMFYKPVSITSHNGMLYILDYRLKKVFQVDPKNGNRQIFADLSRALQPIVLSAGQRNLYVSDPEAHQLIAIDFKTRQARVFSSNQTQKNAHWIAPLGIYFDKKGRRLFVTDYADNAVYMIPTGGRHQGKRIKIVEAQYPSARAHLVYPTQLKLSNDGNIIIADERYPGIFVLNVKTHQLHLLAGPEKGSGPIFFESIALDKLQGNRYIFSDTNLVRFYVTDKNGDHFQILPPLDAKNRLADPWGMAKDTPDSWYITDGGHGRVFKVNFDFAKRTQQQKLIATTKNMPGKTMPGGYKNLLGIQKLSENRFIVSDQTDGELLNLNPTSGQLTLFSGQGPAFHTTVGLAYNEISQNLYATDFLRPALFLVDPVTGNRKILSGKGDNAYIGAGPKPRQMVGIVLVPNTQTAYVSSPRGAAIYWVNLENGNRKLVYKYSS